MILLNLNHFWITQAELRCICKSKFHVCYFFFRNYENPGKNVINPSCPKRPKIINWKKKWHGFFFFFFFFFTLYYGASKTFHLFWGTKKKCEKLCPFAPYSRLGQHGLRQFFYSSRLKPLHLFFLYKQSKI